MNKVIITFKIIGFHAWPDAPSTESYLASRHRHEFHFRCEAMVGHVDRQIEFHNWKRALMLALEKHWGTAPVEFGAKSCEMLALQVVMVSESQCGIRCSAVEVWEDGECGARVEPGT